MQKRLLLAFLLSFLVLTAWSRFFPAEQSSVHKIVPVLPSSLNKELLITEKLEPLPVEPPPGVAEQLETIETTKITARFSNIGGIIKDVYFKEYKESYPIWNIINIDEFATAEFKVIKKDANSIVYQYKNEKLEIKKQYDFPEAEYLIKANINVILNSAMSKQEKIEFVGFSLDVSRLDNSLKDNRDLSLFEYSTLFNNSIYRKDNIVKYSPQGNKFILNKLEPTEKVGQIQWVGLRDRYFAVLVAPKFSTTGMTINSNNNLLSLNILPVSDFSQNQQNYEFNVYFGPQNLSLLQKTDPEFAKIMQFSNWSILDVVAKIIYNILNFIHKIIPNWGVCIIILGIIIYGITYPLTLKSMSSMKKMQALQPKIAQLKEQYKNNPQKLSKEQMELFKEHKINPLGGCLPVLLQMPIFIGFYQVLWRSVMLKGAKFLWIKDLSQPDRLVVFQDNIVFIGKELNLLPLLMGVVMLLQQKISALNMVVSDPAQASQQKMMMIFLPIMMIFIFYKAPSGLNLYFTFFYLLTAFTQWRISKAK